ncbi:intracellular sulfur oxidation DsrE/DsrF family protein [Algoriphagus boseongensis]|uniref:Intracellular sulfur oxidation DsrE/DsrF family protein n=1 Tax=Algoriphagus boseongensis TaxID=1442587 RepID=A0A4V3D2B6_9BACT|nr:DsrE family protein [Algoriphagus boseongensis]TDQ18297.1 intracellular sulfur oxidation DsrE/DsrF family protein [Algoriphagus boseongensis]
MKIYSKIALLAFALFLSIDAFSQTPQYPIVKGYGGIYEIPEATERPDPTIEYKIIVDLTSAAEDNKQISRWVDNVARMMNLHGLAGVPKEKIKVKVVVHGGGIFTLLNDENYKERFEVDNPNIKVYEALKEAGADIMVCGQSLIARNLKQDDLWPGVRIAHSALTTITTYVQQGYVPLKF